MQKRKWSNSILLLLVIFLLTGCGKNTPEMEFASVDEAKEALSTASTVEIYTDLYSKRRETKILADGKVAGYVKWNTVYIGDQEWFSVDYTNDVKGEKSPSSTSDENSIPRSVCQSARMVIPSHSPVWVMFSRYIPRFLL